MNVGKQPIIALVLALTVGGGSAGAASISLQGAFTQDDDVQIIPFMVSGDVEVILRTLSYGGGTNTAGEVIAPIGFDPMLTLFDASGFQLVANDDGTCGAAGDPGTGFCLDSYIQATLTSGSYTLALTQWGNPSIGPTLADGFLQTVSDYTAIPGIQSGPFWEIGGTQRTGAWAVDLIGVDPAGAPVPEPSTLVLLGAGLAARLARRRRRKDREHHRDAGMSPTTRSRNG